MNNINQYNEVEFAERFKKTDIYQSLSRDFDIILFDHLIEKKLYGPPRQHWGDPQTLTSAAPFYYLEFLTAKNPQTIYDLGCGWNIFKRYIPNIIGIDPDSKSLFADVNDMIDDDYIKNHQGYYESIFSINALHFRPLSDLRKVATDFVSMIKPGGMGFLTLNFMRMLERDQEKFKDYTDADFDKYVKQELDNLSVQVDYIVFDVDLSYKDAYMDGNIRFVVHRQL